MDEMPFSRCLLFLFDFFFICTYCVQVCVIISFQAQSLFFVQKTYAKSGKKGALLRCDIFIRTILPFNLDFVESYWLCSNNMYSFFFCVIKYAISIRYAEAAAKGHSFMPHIHFIPHFIQFIKLWVTLGAFLWHFWYVSHFVCCGFSHCDVRFCTTDCELCVCAGSGQNRWNCELESRAPCSWQPAGYVSVSSCVWLLSHLVMRVAFTL